MGVYTVLSAKPAAGDVWGAGLTVLGGQGRSGVGAWGALYVITRFHVPVRSRHRVPIQGAGCLMVSGRGKCNQVALMIIAKSCTSAK
jgi:hypothetical protein